LFQKLTEEMLWNVDTGTRSGTHFACQIIIFEVVRAPFQNRSFSCRLVLATLAALPCPQANPLERASVAEVLSNLSDTARTAALERFHLIRPFLDEGVPLPTLARQHGLSLRTARRWVQRYRVGGLGALAPRPRADKGARRALPPSLAQLVEALALHQPAPSIATIHRKVAAIAIAQDLHVPSYDVVHDIVRQLDPALVTLAHAGSKVYSETFDLLYRREAEAPNAIWQADHTLLDMLLTDDKGGPRKPWLTVILDLKFQHKLRMSHEPVLGFPQ
jgi:transposase-like protein